MVHIHIRTHSLDRCIIITRNAHAHILPRACQPMRKQSDCTEAARARALLTAREARLPTNLRARRKLDLLRMTEVDIPKRG